MSPSKDEQIRAAIAEQAAEWFVANDEGPLDARQSAELMAWLKASPLHVEEFLRVSVVARDLDAAGACLGSVDALVARARAEDEHVVQGFWPRARTAIQTLSVPRWQIATATMAAVALVIFGAHRYSKVGPPVQVSAPSEITALHLATHHGEQKTQRLADNSVLHLNSDTALTVRYSTTERQLVLESGEADFEVAHEPNRPFRVFAGPAVAIAHGTEFDVRLEGSAALLTVIEGRVGVAPSQTARGTGANHEQTEPLVEVQADEQISISPDHWPATPVRIDAHRATAWLHHELAFDHEPLGHVVEEFNRYSAKPIVITTPELRNLQVSGTFSTDDPEEFLAFLRSLEGVQVEVTATQIRVSQK